MWLVHFVCDELLTAVNSMCLNLPYLPQHEVMMFCENWRV